MQERVCSDWGEEGAFLPNNQHYRGRSAEGARSSLFSSRNRSLTPITHASYAEYMYLCRLNE